MQVIPSPADRDWSPHPLTTSVASLAASGEKQPTDPRAWTDIQNPNSSGPDLMHIFPHNPELVLGEELLSTARTVPASPIKLPNPEATLTPETDDDIALPSFFYPEARPSPPTVFPPPPPGAPWLLNNLYLLQTMVMAPVTEQTGMRACKYPKHWEATCGGHRFMLIGMLPHWKDPLNAPGRLREKMRRLGKPRQRLLDPEKGAALDKLLEEEVKEGIVVKIRFEEVGYLSPIFCVDKKAPPKERETATEAVTDDSKPSPAPTKPQKPEKEYRKVVDCRAVNAEMETIHFRMDSPETVQQLAREGDWATSLDLKSAFTHLRVNETLRPFLCFMHKDECYAYQAVPFGAKHSPRYFTEALGYALKYIRAHWDIRIVAYMDDLLLLHQDRDHLQLCTLQIAAFLQFLGWTLSVRKCEFIPAHEITFLGWRWCFLSRTLSMTPPMRHALLSLLAGWIRAIERGERVSSRRLGALIGSLNFLRAQIPRASLYLRTCHLALTRAVASTGWDGFSVVSRETLSELRFWWRSVDRNSPYDFAPRLSQALLTTDASELGWGARLTIGNQLHDSFGFWSETDSLPSSNQRETAAVLRALLQLTPVLRAAAIRAMTVRSDNSATVCNLQRQGAGLALVHLTRQIFKRLMTLDVRLHVMHIPGKDNVLVDALSRMEVSGDYALTQEAYERGIRALNVTPTIDLFAHCFNNKTPRFVALEGPYQIGAVARDAFTLNWAAEQLPYLFPPVQLVHRALQKVREECATAVIVLPAWFGQAWWTTFRELAVLVVELGKEDQVLQPGPAMVMCKVTVKLPPGMFLMALLRSTSALT